MLTFETIFDIDGLGVLFVLGIRVANCDEERTKILFADLETAYPGGRAKSWICGLLLLQVRMPRRHGYPSFVSVVCRHVEGGFLLSVACLSVIARPR